MVDINKLDKNARAAAMKGGTEAWGQWGSAADHVRYAQPIKSRRKCHCGCGQRKTHAGMANGMALTSGCELAIRRWVKKGRTMPLPPTPAGEGG
jgi:hypothetical protein